MFWCSNHAISVASGDCVRSRTFSRVFEFYHTPHNSKIVYILYQMKIFVDATIINREAGEIENGLASPFFKAAEIAS